MVFFVSLMLAIASPSYPDLTLPGPLPFEESAYEVPQEDIIIKVNPRTVDLLIASLNEKDPAVRSQSAWALGDILEHKVDLPEDLNKKIIISLEKALKDSKDEVRATAVSALAKLRQDDDVQVRRGAEIYTIPSALQALKDKHFYVRRSAVQAIGNLKPTSDEVIQDLISALEDEDATVRLQTCHTLAELKAETAIQSLAKRLSDEDKFVRRSASKSIADIGGSAIDILMNALNSKDILLRQEAAWGLGYIASGGAKVPVDSLLTSLKDKDVLLRRNASWALGNIKDTISTDALINTLSDTDIEVRRNSAWALGEIRDNKSLPGLIEHLQDKERVVRAESARALGKLGLTAALEPLINALARVEKEHSSIRRESAWALGEIKDLKSVPALIRAVTEKTIPTQMGMVFDDSHVRAQAALALAKIGAQETVEPLEKCLSNEKEPPPIVLRKALAEALTKLTGKEHTYKKDYRELTYFIESL